MNKAAKILGAFLLVIFILLMVFPLAFKGKVKSMIIKEANKGLNANLAVGNVNLSLIRSFPAVLVSLQQLIITGAGSFEQDTLIKIKTLSVSTGLMDLLNGNPYIIKKIRIDNADLRLKVLADGQENWDIIKLAEDGVSAEESEPFLLKLNSLVINDSRMVYDDKPNVTFFVLEEMNHNLSGDLGADFTSLITNTRISNAMFIYDGIEYLQDAVIDWKANLDIDLVKYIFTFRDNKLVINDFPIVFNGTFGMPEEGYDLDLTFSTPDNQFKQLLSLVPAVYARDFSSVETDGKISFDGMVKGKYIDDQYPAFDINLLVENAWFRYPGLPAEVDGINIGAKIESPGGDLDKLVVDVKNLAMNLAGNPVSGRIYLKNLMTDPYVDTRILVDLNLADAGKFYPLGEGEEIEGNINADITLKGRLSDADAGRYDAVEAAGIFKTQGVEYETSSLAQKIRIENALVNITPAHLDLADLRVKAGRSDFSLRGKATNYLGFFLKGEELNGNFDLRSSFIDVNELLELNPADDADVADTVATSAFNVPAGIDFTLGMSAVQVKYLDYDISNLSGKILVKDQKIILDGVSMNGMGGKIMMNGSYASIDPENPVVDFNLNVKEISIKETFRQMKVVEKFAPVAEKIIGNFSGNIKLSGLLNGQMMPRIESVSGAGDLASSSVRISNVNTLNSLAGALKMDDVRELEIAGARIIVEFLDGVMEVKPFDFKALGIEMNLGGETSLDQRIGYTLKMKIPRSMMGGEANGVLNDLVAKAGQSGINFQPGDYINVDALIGGTITDPTVRLNLAGTGKDVIESVKEQVQQQVEQKVEEIKEDLSAEARKILDDADRQAKAVLDLAKKESDEVLKNARILADDTRKQANASADRFVQEAKGKGTLTEMAAKKSADEVKKQGEKQAENILAEAGKQSAAILDKARLEADRINAEARKKVGQ